MLLRYLHTARHLRLGQVMARIRNRLYSPMPSVSAAPGRRPMTGRYVAPVMPEPTLITPTTFRLLNVEGSCARAQDWRPPSASKLWVYNLHYFDDLNARDAVLRESWHRALLQRWAAENPVGKGDAWEPYPVSRRIVNWVKWAASGHVLPPACHESLAGHARWLLRRLEYHILGNHLFANAKALVHAGLYFSGVEAGRWLTLGLRLIGRELGEQVLPDGGHFELSTMYHAEFIESLLDLVNISRAYGREVPESWLSVITSMRRWLKVMSHPDGEIGFFNDAAFDVAPKCLELDAYARRLALAEPPACELSVVVLKESGYVRVSAGPAYMICDCAPVGPDYLPGHAHADTLSFELSLFGQRLIVNSGTSQYGTDDERQRQRGTAAHNTVMVDGQNSSEVWAGFRVAQRARAFVCNVSAAMPAVIEASHDGYQRLPGRVEHRRSWVLDDRSLTIKDQLRGVFHTAEAFFHLHPDIDATVNGANEVALLRCGRVCAKMNFGVGAVVEVNPGTWHPRFGVSVANRHVVARFSGRSLTTELNWEKVA